jgi:uncharacterized membrane-anchored protein YitT (DUF2179 family)
MKKYAFIYITTLLLSITYTVFLLPISIIDGGMVGIAMIIHHLTSLNTGIVYFFLSLPIFIWAFINHRKIFYRTIWGFLCFSANMYWVSDMKCLIEPNIALSLILGGILTGLCFGLMATVKASPGGFAPIGIYLFEKKIINYGLFIFINDVLVVLLGTLFFDIEQIIYSTIFIGISCVVIYFTVKKTKNKINNFLK